MNKLEEANNNFAKGLNALKCTVCNINGDYLEASEYFKIAFNNYKILEIYDKSFESGEKLVECYEKMKLYKNASMILMEQTKNKYISNETKLHLLNKAKFYLKEYDDSTSIEMIKELIKFSSTIEDKKKVISQNICNIKEDVYKIEVYKPYINSLLHDENYIEAINVYNEMINIYNNLNQHHNVYKTILTIIILYVILSDIVNADKILIKYMETEFINSNEYDIAEDIINYAKTNDINIENKLNNSYTIVSLDHLIVKSFKKYLKNAKDLI
jgi:tetratricopeptide (TPR) repeat protein